MDTIKLFPGFSIVGIANKLEEMQKKQMRLYRPQLILLDIFADGKGIDLIRRLHQHQLRGGLFSLPAPTIATGYHQRYLYAWAYSII